jgi:hypothetical protein
MEALETVGMVAECPIKCRAAAILLIGLVAVADGVRSWP